MFWQVFLFLFIYSVGGNFNFSREFKSTFDCLLDFDVVLLLTLFYLYSVPYFLPFFFSFFSFYLNNIT